MAHRGLIAGVAAVLVLAGPAWGGEEAPSWPRLPDGRVVIDIYGRRLAFPPDMPPGQVVFQHGNRRSPFRRERPCDRRLRASRKGLRSKRKGRAAPPTGKERQGIFSSRKY